VFLPDSYSQSKYLNLNSFEGVKIRKEIDIRKGKSEVLRFDSA
jgi:hypothetical protein